MSPRVAVVIGGLALIPVAVYGITNSMLAGATAALNVVLIIGALWVATRAVGRDGAVAHG